MNTNTAPVNQEASMTFNPGDTVRLISRATGKSLSNRKWRVVAIVDGGYVRIASGSMMKDGVRIKKVARRDLRSFEVQA